MDETVEPHEKYLDRRFKQLGFYPQTELYCNSHLPYADKLDEESQRLLTSIKDDLAKAVAFREMNPAIGSSVKKLIMYIKLYGLKFSKEDHVAFVKLLLSLINIPNVEPLRLNLFFVAISQLLRKSMWLSPDDLEIDWRQLYRLSEMFISKNSSKGELYRYFSREKSGKPLWSMPYAHLAMLLATDVNFDASMLFSQEDQTSIESNLQYIIQLCSAYFSRNSTQEIVDEIYPKLFPLDTGKVCDAFGLLSLFLHSSSNFELWFYNFMDLWDTYHNPTWNVDIMNMIAGVATENIGLIDWEPYIPTMFTRILRSLDLPVCYKNMKSSRNQSLWSVSVAVWIANVLGPKSSCQKYLSKFLGAIESYLHPANSGKWVGAISEIVVQLPKYLFIRLIRERYKPHSWKQPIPDDHKLTENCINEFVESLKPIAFQAVYSRVSATEVGRLFKHLADLRPELIIPNVIERVYTTLDSVTEPHKMTAALQCLVSVSRALVSGHNGYTQGKTHVIPILFATLPGIDPNDFKKTSVTLEFLTSFALLVPIVDCSKTSLYYDNLTEEEMLICDQTADFEGFVLQYLDKIFSLIESSTHDMIRMEQSDEDNLRSKLESIAETLLQSSTHGILGQCSQDIIASATRKLVDWVKGHLFEPRVAAHLVASLVRVFTRIAGREMRKQFVPYLISTINTYIDDHDDITDIEKQSDELLYYVILLSSIARGDPHEVIAIVDDIIPIVDKISKFKCKLTNKYSNAILLNILSNVSTFQTLDVRSCPDSYEKPLSEFLPIRHWGQKTTYDTKIKWYIPNRDAVRVCEMIIHRYLPPILEQFERYANNEITLSRDEIYRDASSVLALLKCANFLPNWDTEEPLNLVDSSIERATLNITIGFDGKIVCMPDGSNVRLAVIKTITRLQEKILAVCDDDIKSLKIIIMIWDRVHMRRHYTTPFDSQLKNYKNLKTFQDYTLTKHKRDIRAILATRVIMQQDCRDELSPPAFTASHRTIMFNLLKLSTSHYSAVRATAQHRLFILFHSYSFSYRCILDEIVDYLSLDSNENHEAFKGILYVIGGTRRGRLIVRNNWSTIQKIWIALLKTNLSEKPSVVRLLDMINEAILNEFPTLTIELNIPDTCISLAMKLVSRSDLITEADIEQGKQNEAARNAENLKLYNTILLSILEVAQSKSIHWRYGLLASSMIDNLVHPVVKYSPEIVKYCVHNLINESIEERKTAIRCVRFILKQQKRDHPKIKVNPFEIAGCSSPATGKLSPGIRDDNRWLQYDIAKAPKSQIDWDQPRFSHKIEGFFGWTPDFSVYAPSEQQPKLDRNRDEMNPVEQVLYDFFSNEEMIKKLIDFWSLEEKKGKEKFNRRRFFIIQNVCDMFGDGPAKLFLCHIQRLIEGEKLESNHRCAAELMSGIMRGMKHWPYEKTKQMYDKLIPIIRLALSNITVETDVFWGTCFATASENFDPMKQHWLHEILMEDPLKELTSFVGCSRIYCLQGPFNQHVWRMTTVSHRLLEYFRPYMNHSFQNVRERLGSILINIFEADLNFSGNSEPECPRIKDMIAYVLDKVQILKQDMPQIAKKDNTDMETESSESNSEYDEAIRLFKTVCQWLVGILNRNTNGNVSEYFDLLPFACRLERCEQDVELADSCASLLAMLSQALTLPNCMETALRKIDEVSLMSSWSARLAVIDVLQVLVFNNMSIVLSRDEWVQLVQVIVLRLLEDSILEVRIKAAQVLGGLLHCSFLPATDKLLELFKKKCKTRIIKSASRRILANCSTEVNNKPENGNMIIETQEAESVRMRHMGVLGLCAFISAYPYDIPDFVPDVFEHLGAHLNDPQPIPSTIRKTVGDFKRTHHDNWATHQLKFTENQLAVLSDLTIPPSYYA